jgi:hypothetical protein
MKKVYAILLFILGTLFSLSLLVRMPQTIDMFRKLFGGSSSAYESGEALGGCIAFIVFVLFVIFCFRRGIQLLGAGAAQKP